MGAEVQQCARRVTGTPHEGHYHWPRGRGRKWCDGTGEQGYMAPERGDDSYTTGTPVTVVLPADSSVPGEKKWALGSMVEVRWAVGAWLPGTVTGFTLQGRPRVRLDELPAGMMFSNIRWKDSSEPAVVHVTDSGKELSARQVDELVARDRDFRVKWIMCAKSTDVRHLAGKCPYTAQQGRIEGLESALARARNKLGEVVSLAQAGFAACGLGEPSSSKQNLACTSEHGCRGGYHDHRCPLWTASGAPAPDRPA